MSIKLNIRFPYPKEWVAGFLAGLYFAVLNKKGFALTGKTQGAAFLSLWTLFITTPIWIYAEDRIAPEAFSYYHVDYMEHQMVYAVAQAFAFISSLQITWLFLKWEGKPETFWAYMAASNWFNLIQTVIFPIPLFFLVNSHLVYHHQIQSISTVVYIYYMTCAWFVAWKTTGINPFLAAGLTIIGPMMVTMAGDFINVKYFGVVRPFEQDWYVDIYNATTAKTLGE